MFFHATTSPLSSRPSRPTAAFLRRVRRASGDPVPYPRLFHAANVARANSHLSASSWLASWVVFPTSPVRVRRRPVPDEGARRDRKRANTGWDEPIRVPRNPIYVAPETVSSSCGVPCGGSFWVCDPKFPESWPDEDRGRVVPPGSPGLISIVAVVAPDVSIDEVLQNVVSFLLFASSDAFAAVVLLVCVSVWLVAWRSVPPWREGIPTLQPQRSVPGP